MWTEGEVSISVELFEMADGWSAEAQARRTSVLSTLEGPDTTRDAMIQLPCDVYVDSLRPEKRPFMRSCVENRSRYRRRLAWQLLRPQEKKWRTTEEEHGKLKLQSYHVGLGRKRQEPATQLSGPRSMPVRSSEQV